MEGTVVLSVLNAKYVHASPAPWCLAAGIRAYAPELFCRVRIVEANINQPPAEVMNQIVSQAPAVVGFSCYIWNINATLTLCRALKKALPHIVVVLGGPEVSFSAKEVIEDNAQADYILAGEGEESLPAFLRTVFAQDKPGLLPCPPQLIAGLCGRFNDGTVYENPPRAIIGDVPSPLTVGYGEAVKGRLAYFETSRGCPYSCAFCLSGSGSIPRYFELDAVFRDFVRLANSGARTIKFVDRTFNANPAHANKILRFILNRYGKEIPRGICFHFEIAGDILREETFVLLAQMPIGAVQLEIGMQSFYEKTLEAVKRKTDTTLLQANIKRLTAMGNMHIHIDLIAGLPFEDLTLFAESFNKGYRLGAHILQLGFLKLLHGSAMRGSPQEYPCEFDKSPPYEVRSTPWLSAQDLDLLRNTESAVNRVYNSGRFRLTESYVLSVSGQTPFDFYTVMGIAADKAGVKGGVSLDDYTAVLQKHCASLANVDLVVLRDFLVRDRLATNSNGRLPPCLYRQDMRLPQAAKRLAENPATAPKKSIRRSVALLYSSNTVCWADHDPAERDPVTGRWPLQEMPMDSLPQ